MPSTFTLQGCYRLLTRLYSVFPLHLMDNPYYTLAMLLYETGVALVLWIVMDNNIAYEPLIGSVADINCEAAVILPILKG